VKPYNQYCPVAHALDLVGERWSLLVVRELQQGPLRYSDLQDRLPGCSTNVLADRLRGLETAGILGKRRLPPPAASTVYELTPQGEGLRTVLAALARWGAQTLGPPDATQLDEGWLARALSTVAAPTLPEGRIAFCCGDEAASIIDGVVEAGVAPTAAATVTCDPPGFYHLLVDGELAGVSVDGDASEVQRLAEAMSATS
jgi:DNA-binding HxlR family transcriptional regulator